MKHLNLLTENILLLLIILLFLFINVSYEIQMNTECNQGMFYDTTTLNCEECPTGQVPLPNGKIN
jgi:hypothetical protein